MLILYAVEDRYFYRFYLSRLDALGIRRATMKLFWKYDFSALNIINCGLVLVRQYIITNKFKQAINLIPIPTYNYIVQINFVRRNITTRVHRKAEISWFDEIQWYNKRYWHPVGILGNIT